VAYLLQKEQNDWYLIPAMPFWSLAIVYANLSSSKFFKDNKIVLEFITVSILLAGFNFTKYIKPLYSSDTVYYQYKSAIEIQKKTSPKEAIVQT